MITDKVSRIPTTGNRTAERFLKAAFHLGHVAGQTQLNALDKGIT
jgi:hypothetical protein